MGLLAQQLNGCAPTEAKPAEALDIAALTRRMCAGEDSAYREFYDAYYHRLLRYLLVVAAGDEEAATEALEATLLRVVRYIKPLDSEQVLWNWLTVVARTAHSDSCRKRRRYLAFLDRFTSHAAIVHTAPDTAETDARMQDALGRSLASLPPDERQLLEWKYYAHRSVQEIAQELQTSEKAIESRLVRVRRKLKLALMAELKND